MQATGPILSTTLVIYLGNPGQVLLWDNASLCSRRTALTTGRLRSPPSTASGLPLEPQGARSGRADGRGEGGLRACPNPARSSLSASTPTPVLPITSVASIPLDRAGAVSLGGKPERGEELSACCPRRWESHTPECPALYSGSTSLNSIFAWMPCLRQNSRYGSQTVRSPSRS